MRFLVAGTPTAEVTIAAHLEEAIGGAVTSTSEPVLVHLLGSRGALAAGLGDHEATVVLFKTNAEPPAVFHAVGDPNCRSSQQPLAFMWSKGKAEFYKGLALPADTATRALRHFLERDDLPDWLQWEEERRP